MLYWCTEMQAIDQSTGELKLFAGPPVLGISWQDAQQNCKVSAPYLVVTGQLHVQIKYTNDGPDWTQVIDYDTLNNN